MKWVKFRIKTVTEAEDIIISTLYDLGLEGAQIEDKVPLTAMEKEQMFVDILPDGPEDDGIAYLSFCRGKRGRQSGSGRGEDHDRSCTCGCKAGTGRLTPVYGYRRGFCCGR